MPLIIDHQMLMREIENVYVGHKKRLAGTRLSAKVIEEACPFIEQRLADPDYLNDFTWDGKPAFYNDEPGGTKEIKGMGGYHLVDNFSAVPETGAGGWGRIHLSNPKEVTSRRGKWNLFDDLMYPGWGAYSIPDKPQKMLRGSHKRESFLTVQQQMIDIKPMTFYYRYKSAWFYNVSRREGINDSLHSKFKEYILQAILYGIEKAIEGIVERGEGSEEMKSILEAVSD
jgi:hypothetical protein